MGVMIVRRKNEDGKFYYGLWTLPAPNVGSLYAITVEGEGDLPPFPSNPATPEEHEAWLKALRDSGLRVKEQEIVEPKE